MTVPVAAEAQPDEKQKPESRKPPVVSLVMPTWNQAATLPAALESVLASAFKDIELIVVDDGSDDNTGKILAAITDSRVRTLRKSHSGISESLNTGFDVARGQYWGWVSSDNIYYPDYPGLLVKALQANPGSVFAYAGFHVHRNGKWISTAFKGYPYRSGLALERSIGGLAFLYRRSAAEKAGRYVEKTAATDLDYWLRLEEVGPFVSVPNILGIFNDDEGNMSEQLSSMESDRIRFDAMVRRGLVREMT